MGVVPKRWLYIQALLSCSELFPFAFRVSRVGTDSHNSRAGLVQRATEVFAAEFGYLLLHRHLPREYTHRAVDNTQVLHGEGWALVGRVVDVVAATLVVSFHFVLIARSVTY